MPSNSFEHQNYPITTITKSPNPFMNGVLIIDKPAGLTSHDVVSRVRRILGERSIGHLGTLDPMATGVLPLVVGNFTRLAQFYLHSEKSTKAQSASDSPPTPTTPKEIQPARPQDVSLNKESSKLAATRFRGLIQQIPPPFSAKKIKGVPAYKLARKQKEVVSNRFRWRSKNSRSPRWTATVCPSEPA